jgi:hypothetical protein
MYYFVGGYPRTGTTLVANLLSGDPEANPPLSEIAYFEYLMFPFEAMMNSWDSNHWRLFDDLDHFQEYHKGVLEMFLQHLQAKWECKKLVVKRPFLSRWFPVLAEFWPEAKFVVCVRDPRDVMGSLKRVQHRHREMDLNQQHLNPFLDLPLIEYAYGYLQGIDECVGASRTYPGQFVFVCYEDLVTDPDKSLQDIGQALGMDLSLVEEHWNSQRWNEDNPYHSEGWGKPITADNIGKHKTQLNDEEVEMVRRICAPIMEVFNYE